MRIANVILWVAMCWLAFGAAMEVVLFRLAGFPFGIVLLALAWLIWKNLIGGDKP